MRKTKVLEKEKNKLLYVTNDIEPFENNEWAVVVQCYKSLMLDRCNQALKLYFRQIILVE